MRGLQCTEFEYAELQAMTFDQREQLYCTYSFASSSANAAGREASEGARRSNTDLATLREAITMSSRCIAAMQKVRGIVERDTPGRTMNCDRYVK
jgi:hypothetical protein